MKGNIITYPQEPNQLLNLLPEIPASDMIQIIFIGTVKPAYIDLNKIFNVRRERIKITLEWLIKNNHLYKTVKISDENLSKFPADGVPDIILNNIEYIESDDLNYYENKGYDSLNLTANSTFDNSDIVLENSGLFETDESLKMSIIDQINVLKNKKSSNRKSTIISDDIPTNKNILIPHGSIPVCEINNPNHLMCAYPTLFPYGIGGIMDPLRKIKLKYRNHVVHLLSLNSIHLF